MFHGFTHSENSFISVFRVTLSCGLLHLHSYWKMKSLINMAFDSNVSYFLLRSIYIYDFGH